MKMKKQHIFSGSQHYIPNIITCSNLVSGCIATYLAFMADFKMALVWIIIGAGFDFCDGLSARLLKVSSPIGKELDSLADDITFGLAPAAIVFSDLQLAEYPDVLHPVANVLPYVAFLIAAFSAIRLAKFNIDTRQATMFMGLPTPANALFWGSLVLSQGTRLGCETWGVWVILLLIGVSCWLMVADMPMFALKFKQWGWKGNEIRYSFIAIAIVTLALFGLLSGWWLVVAWYVVVSCFIDVK